MGTDADVAASLSFGELSVVGRLVDSSNSALVVRCQLPADPDAPEVVAVYKPTAGERPLWDFHRHTLGNREVAAYLLSEALGWHLVPVTTWREEGPAGQGMCQQWIETEDTADVIDILTPQAVPAGWHVVVEGRDEADQTVVLAHCDSLELRRMAAFDVIANNTDRKVGHILKRDGHLLGIDHGVTFHVEDKLRTVIWGFADSELDESILTDLRRLHASFPEFTAALRDHLDEDEIGATHERLDALLASKMFPLPSATGPAIPWPII